MENTPLEDVWEAIANLTALGVDVERNEGLNEPTHSLGIALDYLADAARKLEAEEGADITHADDPTAEYVNDERQPERKS